MSRVGYGLNKATVLLVIGGLCLSACDDGSPATTTTITEPVDDTTTSTTEPVNAVEIRWGICLGGCSEDEIQGQVAIAERFNNAQSEVHVSTVVVESTQVLQEVAESGEGVDVVGPIDGETANVIEGLCGSGEEAFFRLNDLVAAKGVDLSTWPEALVEGYMRDGSLHALPFAANPSVLWYNKELFDAARLPYPPLGAGALYGPKTKYEGEWDFQKLGEIARLLTKDSHGDNSTERGFDRSEAVQWGFAWVGRDRLFDQGSHWGAGTVISEDGEIEIPQSWEDGWRWYQDAVWNQEFSPSREELGSDLLSGNPFLSGKVGMVIGSATMVEELAGRDSEMDLDWLDLGALPSNNGVTTSTVETASFRIMSGTNSPEASFDFYLFLVNSDATPEIVDEYGMFPAIPGSMTSRFSSLGLAFPEDLNWGAVSASLQKASVPSHLQYVSNWNGYIERMAELLEEIQENRRLGIQSAIARLESDLEGILTTSD